MALFPIAKGPFGLLICLYQVNRIKYGLTIYMHLWTNYDSEKVSPITLVKTSLKIARVPYDPLQNFLQNGLLGWDEMSLMMISFWMMISFN